MDGNEVGERIGPHTPDCPVEASGAGGVGDHVPQRNAAR